MDDIEIADLKRLTALIKEKYDYDFRDYAVSSFKRRIMRVMDLYKFKTAGALIKKIGGSPSFFKEFVSEITVNVTEMFRDPTFWIALRDQVLPPLFSSNKQISIWHSGCSSGEEVFSMVILLREMGKLNQVNIVATDIDDAIIKKAKKGLIDNKNMVLNGKNYERAGGRASLDMYFDRRSSNSAILPDLLSKVSFRTHDLVNGGIFSKFDIILCRNVMIYFNQNLQNDVLYKLHGSLFNYGYLAIGCKESLIWCDISSKFLVVNNEEKIYKKTKE